MKRTATTITFLALLALNSGAQDMFETRQLTSEPAREGFPCWSPDGSRIAYSSSRERNVDILVMEVDIEKVISKLGEINE